MSRAFGILAVFVVLLAYHGEAWALLIHTYEYENVVVSKPVTITGPGSKQIRLQLPVEGMMLTPHLKGCDGAAMPNHQDFKPIVEDENLVFIPLRRHPDKGFLVVLVGDRKPGRTQTYCVRLPYVPHEEEGD
jgi:hypothetical protein